MNRFRRKLTFQLTPLLDLLLIVIFSQYMEARQKSQAEQRQTDRERQEFVSRMDDVERQRMASLDAQERARGELARVLEDNAALQRQAREAGVRVDETRQAATEAVDRANRQRDLVGQVLGELFRIPPEILDKAFAGVSGVQTSRNPKDVEALKENVRALARLNPAALVAHFVKVDEWRKRCDVWEIHLTAGGQALVHFDQKVHSFRFVDPLEQPQAGVKPEVVTAKLAERFQSQLFDYYKSLPQTKSVLILILSYGDNTTFLNRRAAIEGMKKLAVQIRADSGARIRVDYTVLGEVSDDQSTKSGP